MKPLPRVINLTRPALNARWIHEPLLGFADGVEHIDPKVGIAYAGPRSLGTARHRAPINVGFIGTAEGTDRVRKYLESAALGVAGDEDHAPFPGFLPDRGFRTLIRCADELVETITASDTRSLLKPKKRQRDRFEELLLLLESRLRVLCGRDTPLDCVLVVLPDDLVKRCGTANYRESGRQTHRDLHSAFKAIAMKYLIPTQIIWESTTGLTDDSGTRDLDHPAEIVWNLHTGIYFKSGGLPWSPIGLLPGTCFVGISFYRPQGESSSMRTSVAQAFSESGDAFVLRGQEFTWEGRSPHIPADHASTLTRQTMERYQLETGRPPKRVIVFKRSRFDGAEREGFQDALQGVEYDLLALRRVTDIRLMRQGAYPPLRGTAFDLGGRSYLYTMGTIPQLGYYPHGHVPATVELADHVGDTASDDLLSYILLLTKLNWNSAKYAEREPVTLEFAERVGDVLKEIAPGQEPEAKYSYYM